ncbi:hypothetical protein ABZ477_13530 [Microbacterium sp. NPDC019599]|uniref:hypothetical protein n=1 Tax=Microbacterium sp. NPDC019599 TaxID=3154690 RepID=UPI0033F0EC86
MERAIVLIGVKQTGGGLPTLQAVDAGIRAMEDWAKWQEIPDRRIAKLSDESGGPIKADVVLDTITAFCDGSLDQLLVYFAGHGTVRGSDEVWLLSGAPDKAHEAIDLNESIDFARYCNVGNVVFISDACRTPATRRRAQLVTGIAVFPTPATDEEHPVDVFYATSIGHASFELLTPTEEEPDPHYKALYTEALVSALRGQHPEAMDPDGDDGFAVVRTKPRLNEFLRKDVARRLAAAGEGARIQKPVARALSDDVLSRFPLAKGVEPGLSTAPPGGPVSAEVDPVEQLRQATRSILGLDVGAAGGALGGPPDLVVLARARDAATVPVTDREAGLIAAGATVSSARATGGEAVLLDDARVVVRGAGDTGSVDVAIRTADGSAFVLPAPVAATTVAAFSAGELRDLLVVPTDGRTVRADVHRLRSILSARTRLGDLWLEDDEATALATFVADGSDGDLALALYAAYALADRRRVEDVRRIDEAVRGRWAFRPFDLAMLSGDLDGRAPADVEGVHPSTPLLARGWAAARLRGIRLPVAFEGIEPNLVDSIWTQVEPAAADALIGAVIGEREE